MPYNAVAVEALVAIADHGSLSRAAVALNLSQPSLSRQIGTHKCAGTPTDGCAAATPAIVTVRSVVSENGSLRTVTRTVEATPRYDAKAGRTLLARLILALCLGRQHVALQHRRVDIGANGLGQL